MKGAILVSLVAVSTGLLTWRKAKPAQEESGSDTRQAVRNAGFSFPLAGCAAIAAAMLVAGSRQSRSLRRTRAELREVRENEQRYQLLAARLQQIREEESGRLARRVHDDLDRP